MAHNGRDFSNFQGDLTPADCADIDFAFVLATDGGSFKNPDAVQQVQMLRSQGVHVGLYHFFRPTDSISGQSNNLAAYAHALGGTSLPIAVDFETADPAGWPDAAHKLMQFVMVVEGWTDIVPNRKSIIYVNESFYTSLATAGFPWGRWVWYARPGVETPDKPCLVWQSGQRAVAGASIDYDQFMGTEADWAAFTLSAQPAPTTPPVTNFPEDDVQSTSITFKTDGNGNAWVASPLPINQVVAAVPINIDPAKVGTYTNVPRFAGITADNQLVFEAGAPNAEFGFTVWAAS